MKYDLVFEGGGAKGMVFVGALQAFEAEGHTFGRLLGTSAGAITATLLAAGYTAREMLDALAEKRGECSVFAGFMSAPAPFEKTAIQASATREFLRRIDLPLIPERFEEKLDDVLAEWIAKLPGLRHVFSFIERGGWYAADNFLDWLKQKLDVGACHGQPRQFSGLTLEQFYDVTHVDLSLVAVDTTANRMLVLNHQTAPNVPVVWAVRMSMSIPLVWEEVIWQAEWGCYRGRELTRHTIVDGGLLSNFPLELFVSDSASVIDLMGPKVGNPVLGMLIDETLSTGAADITGGNDATLNIDELQTVKRLTNLLDTMMCARDKMVLDEFETLVVHLPAQGYSTTDFNMSDERRELLVQAGRNAMKAYLEESAVKPRAIKPRAEVERIQHTADKFARRILDL